MENSLAFCTNMFGNIKPEIAKRLQAVIDDPNPDTWDDAHCIIISKTGKMTTLWQAVIKVDPFFQRSASMDENCKTKWERIPSSETIKKAINLTVYNISLN